MKALHWADKVKLDVLLKPLPWPPQLLVHVPFIWYFVHICILYLHLTVNDKTWMSQTEISAQPAWRHSLYGMCAVSPCPHTTETVLLHSWMYFLNFSKKTRLSTCFSSHCSGQSGWNRRLPQSDKDFCTNKYCFYLIFTVHPNGFSFDTRSSLKRVWRSKKSGVSCMDFVKGIAQNRSPVLIRKASNCCWTLSKWLKPQKIFLIQTSTSLWQLQDQAH